MNMRNFKRDSVFTPCALSFNTQNIKAFMVNFSRMGAMITTQYQLSPKKYVSLIYLNEKNEQIRMLTYVVHSTKVDHYFLSGLQFVGIEEKKSS